ncbi:MAG TPA: D-alanyl-D-alanine carboxypeptidase/D-alanyl-D-alanine-endopeptidase [Pyrinomonadaceae bacterium]|nr:D-alanyl-D-alanine carboxypeptidase/D-alanyl-D-alanine-endopeptidase [Pyrinomonadaceae bacterium]
MRLLLLSLFVFSTSCLNSVQKAEIINKQEPVTEHPTGFEIPPPNINLSNPLIVSTKTEDLAMCAEINEKIDKSAYANAHWGVIAVSLKDGRVVCSRDGRKLFNPASIQKTLTAIVALDKLGPNFRWKTSILAANQIDSEGTLNGDLILRGEGAPDFGNAELENLITQLQSKGLKRIKGNIIGDSSYFRGDDIGDGWTWNELQWYYGAEAGALTFNENQAFVNVENGIGKVSTDYIHVTVGNPEPFTSSNTNANKESNYETGGVKRGLGDNEFYVWGSSKSFGMRVAVHNSAMWAAKTLRENLEKKGILIEGQVKSRDWRSEDGFDVEKAQNLAQIESSTLAEIVKKMNKNSINLFAELILRTIGKKFGREVPNNIQIPQNVRGDDIVGAAIIKKWLMENRIAADEIQISDGSGLSRLDFITPESFAKAFIVAAKSPFSEIFTESLPIAGTDGTLGGRLAKAKGQVLAKTGTVTFVNSLAGYAQNKSGEIYTFAIVANNETHKNLAVSIIDQIVLTLVGIKDDELKKENSTKTNQNNNINNNSNKPNFVTNAMK